MNTYSLLTPLEIQFVKDNYGKIPAREIAIKLNRCENTIGNHAKKLNLTSSLDNCKHNANLPLIKSMSDPEVVYMLGYLWADGHLRVENKQNIIKPIYLTFAVLTKDIIEVKNILEKLGKGRYYNRKPNPNFKNPQPITYWCLTDKYLAKYLYSLDFHIKIKVSPTKLLSLIPDNLKHYWWRGYLDGDGCIYHLPNKVPVPVSFSAPRDYDWTGLIADLSKLGFRSRMEKNPSCSKLLINHLFETLKFLDFVYKNRENDKIGLTRKYNKYLIIKDYDTPEPIRKNPEPYIQFINQAGPRWRVELPIHIKSSQRCFNFKSLENAIICRDRFFKNGP